LGGGHPGSGAFAGGSLCKLICRNTVDDLCIPRPKRKAPEARAALATFAADYARREAELGRIAEKLRTDRDKAIRRAYRDGLPMSAIAEVLAISHQRVSQIVRS
jgi:DNA-binding NarL/FixJ family response regulator